MLEKGANGIRREIALTPEADSRYKGIAEDFADLMIKVGELEKNPTQSLVETIKGRMLYHIGIDQIELRRRLDDRIKALIFKKNIPTQLSEPGPEEMKKRFEGLAHLISADMTSSTLDGIYNQFLTPVKSEDGYNLVNALNEPNYFIETTEDYLKITARQGEEAWNNFTSGFLGRYAGRFGMPEDVKDMAPNYVIISQPERTVR